QTAEQMQVQLPVWLAGISPKSLPEIDWTAFSSWLFSSVMELIPDAANGLEILWFVRVILNPVSDSTYMYHHRVIIKIVFFFPYRFIKLPLRKNSLRVFHEMQKQLVFFGAKLN